LLLLLLVVVVVMMATEPAESDALIQLRTEQSWGGYGKGSY
jgi:hypothetical protein